MFAEVRPKYEPEQNVIIVSELKSLPRGGLRRNDASLAWNWHACERRNIEQTGPWTDSAVLALV
jgi:hypothetical protein